MDLRCCAMLWGAALFISGLGVHGAIISYNIEVRDWIVDYQRPTTVPRKAPFDIPTEFKKAAILANNSYPGPLLEAHEGDCLKVGVINGLLDGEVGIDWEGVEVEGSHGLAPPQGGNVTYHFIASKAGTFWWHARRPLQAARGLKGMLLVRSRHASPSHKYKKERLMVLSEEWAVPQVCLDATGSLLEGCSEIDRATLNGQWGDGSSDYPLPVVEVQKGQCYLLRFLGMLSQPRFFQISIQNHAFQIIDQKATVPSFDLHAGKSVDAVLCADQAVLWGDFRINMTYVGKTQVRSFFATLRYPLVGAADPIGYV